MLDEPIKNFCQSAVDDTVKKNIEFHHNLGLSPNSIRVEVGNRCDWCKAIVGTYNYPNEVPKDVYKRHRYCRCQVVYDPANGSKNRQDVWSKKGKSPEEGDKLKVRKIETEKTIFKNNENLKILSEFNLNIIQRKETK